VRLAGGPATERLLTEPHVTIGRSPHVELVLDHDTVSRRHAGLYKDPFGRWWVRDLDSTNGTLVNGDRVRDRALTPGDVIKVGDYTLRLLVPPGVRHTGPPDDTGPMADDPSESEGSPTNIRTFDSAHLLPRLSATHLSALMDHYRRFFTVGEASERLAVLCKLAISEELHGTMALVVRVKNGQVQKVLSGPHRPRGGDAGAPPYLSRRVLVSVQERGEPVLASNLPGQIGDNVSLELTISHEDNPQSAIACPLRTEASTSDVLYVTLPPQYGNDEWLALLSLAVEAWQQAEMVWAARRHAESHAAIERELEMARRIQTRLVPREPSFPGLDVVIGFDPCKWVGGDYVDAVPMPDGRVLFIVADVCGKGLQAALITSSMHTMVRATIQSTRPDARFSPDRRHRRMGIVELMGRVNEYLCEYLPEDSFATMVGIVIDPLTGALECVNAGHPPALIVTPSGCTRQLQVARNTALGVDRIELAAQQESLAQGDVLLLYTDGLTELRNGFQQMLGEERLSSGVAEAYAAGPERPVQALADDLRAMLERFRGDQMPEDDRAFLIARRT
jgi:phosphoserine phosphatase RsbU/P